MPNIFKNPWKNKNTNQRPLYGNAYETDFNMSLDNYSSDSPIYGYNQPSYPPAYSNEDTWDSGKHEYAHFENEPSSGGWLNKSNVAPQSMTTPKPPKKASTHIPFLEHRQDPQDTFSGTAYRYTNPQRTSQKSSSVSSKWSVQSYQPPNKWRFWFRFLSLLTSIGHLGFAAGASPYSGEPVPSSTASCFYYLYAISTLSIIWSLFHILFYFYRRIFKKQKLNRVMLFSIDLLLSILWGIGLIVEAIKYKCTDGGKFCVFYNVSLFWGFFSFALYIISAGWDLFGACNQRH